MSWFQKLLPPKIKRRESEAKKSVPEGLWHKWPNCQAVLYHSDLEKNQSVCPKCSHHHRINARTRLDLLLDGEGRFEIGAEVLPIDTLKFKDSRKYSERLIASKKSTDEDDALVVMQGSIHAVPVVVAAFEFNFMGGSMGSVVGERFVRGVQIALEQKLPFVCVTASGGARMQGGLAARHRADGAPEAARRLPACRVPAREGRDRHDRRPPAAARQAARASHPPP